MAPFMAPSSDLAPTIRDIERKVNMSLDEIIKQSKGMEKQYTKMKDWNRTRNLQTVQALKVQKPQLEQQKGQMRFRAGFQQKSVTQQGRVLQQRKDLLQRFVALRSSALRQEKLKAARARSGGSMSLIGSSKPAGRQILSGNNVLGPVNRFSRKTSQGTIQRVGATPRQPNVLSTVRNTNALIVNQLSMTGAAKRSAAARLVPLARAGMPAPALRQTWRTNKVLANGSVRRPQTLDSRFASLREERQLQNHFGSASGWRR